VRDPLLHSVLLGPRCSISSKIFSALLMASLITAAGMLHGVGRRNDKMRNRL